MERERKRPGAPRSHTGETRNHLDIPAPWTPHGDTRPQTLGPS